eukprot:3397810-Pleurochrysis_carterae.AAC.8
MGKAPPPDRGAIGTTPSRHSSTNCYNLTSYLVRTMPSGRVHGASGYRNSTPHERIDPGCDHASPLAHLYYPDSVSCRLWASRPTLSAPGDGGLGENMGGRACDECHRARS